MSSVSPPSSDPATVETHDQPEVGPDQTDIIVDTRCGTAVKRIPDPAKRNGGAFRPLYTGNSNDEDVEVELVRDIPASEAPDGTRQVIIDRPDWPSERRVSPGDIRVITEDNFA
jgi:hypothetical protein